MPSRTNKKSNNNNLNVSTESNSNRSKKSLSSRAKRKTRSISNETINSKRKRYDQAVKDEWFQDPKFTHFKPVVSGEDFFIISFNFLIYTVYQSSIGIVKRFS